MLYNLKLAFRNLKRGALYTWLNIIGLAIGFTAAIFILLWVQDEWNYDKFHDRSDDIYILYNHYMENGQEQYLEYLPAPLARSLQAELAEIEAATSLGYDWELGYLDYNGTKYVGSHYTDFAFVDTSFFNVFNLDFIEGIPDNAFPDPYAVIITDELANSLFGGEPAMGKMIKDNNGNTYHVTAVIKKVAENSELKFKALFSFERTIRKSRWGQWSNRVFVLVNPNADIDSLGQKIKEVHAQHTRSDGNGFPYVLMPINKAHLYNPDGSEAEMKNIRMFTIIAIAILIIACINYINLITARARKRAKEIAMRKLVGAKRTQLFFQMMSETFILLFVAGIIAIGLLYLLTPYYSQITDKNLVFNLFDPNILGTYLICFLFIFLAAGIYPAVFISSFKFSEAFKPQTERKGRFSLRKALIVLQFACSSALILTTLVINKQQKFMQTKDLGYEKENIFTIDILANHKANRFFDAFKQDLLQTPGVIGVSASEQAIIEVGNFADLHWDGKPDNTDFSTAVMGIDRNLFSLLNMKIVEGQGFSGTNADSTALFVNEAAVRLMNLKEPLNTVIGVGGWGLKGKITGVVEDFHFLHMSEPIEPIVMFWAHNYWTIYVKIAPGQVQEVLAATKKIWDKYDNEFPFQYQFMDEIFDKIYKKDMRTRNLFNIFAFIAILISCLGLFGLATYMAEMKTKEIGIRKVLGASITNIVSMLSKEFLILVGIAMLIAFPLAWYWLEQMLQDYAYRIQISWWMFALSFIIVVIITLITVSFQAIKAATANPVNSIKTE